jgi:hypothetical protein
MMFRVNSSNVLITVALALGAMCYTARADGISEDLLLSRARSANEEASSNLTAMEPKALAEASARREGDRLELRLQSGKIKSYVDGAECKKPAEEVKCERYSLIVHARTRSAFILGKQYYEGLDVLLVDDNTGEETKLRSIPSFSPTGQHLIVFLEDDQLLGFEVQIWRRVGNRFREEWSGSPNSDGIYVTYRLVQWPSENVVVVESKTSYGPSKSDVVKQVSIGRNAKGWAVLNGG